MISLFWKFWIAITVAIIGMLGVSVLLSSQWHRFESFSETQARPDILLGVVADRLETTLIEGGDPGPILTSNEMSAFGSTYLIDPQGADWLGRPIPPEVLASEPAEPADDPATRPPTMFARALRSEDGSLYFMIFQFNTNPQPLWVLFRRFGTTWLLFATLLASGVVATLLALYVANPLRRLAHVSKQLGEGEYEEEIGPNLLSRRDEVGALARQLKASARQTRDVLSRQSDLIRDVSHEVRTPLARLHLAAESLELCPTDNRAHQQIQREINQIDDLVQMLLHLSKPKNETEYNETVDIKKLVVDRAEQSEIVARQKEVSLNLNLQCGCCSLKGNRTQLAQALDNLVSNAIRYSPDQGRVDIQCYEVDNAISVAVSDQGEGVEVGRLEAIFEPFVRLDRARQRMTGGFGIGLALVKKIVNQHGGSVTAKNTLPKGLRVTITIPKQGGELHA